MTDAILILGGGIAGASAALECVAAGARAIIVERSPVVGGKLLVTMPDKDNIGDRAEGSNFPAFSALADNDSVEIMTLAELAGIEGRAGLFSVTVRERARFVTDTCTRCNRCRAVCPVVVSNEFDAGLTYRKAIHTPMQETLPEAYVIDIDNCLNTPPNYLPCNRCSDVCDDDSIHFDVALTRLHERQVGAVVVATGFEIEDGAEFTDLGYGAHADMLTSAELQRMLESPGPSGGFATRPSNEEYPQSALLVLDNLSSFGLYIVASHAHQLLDQGVDRVEILILDRPRNENGGEKVRALTQDTALQVRWGAMFKVDTEQDDPVAVMFEDLEKHRFVKETFDIVVLCADTVPAEGTAELATLLGIDVSDDGNVMAADSAVSTSRDGIYVAGCASGPKDIKTSIAEARAAATKAIADLNQRLLKEDYVPGASQQQAAGSADSSDAEMQRRIEQALYSLLQDSPTE